MNLQQLEYIIAVDTYRHFATAADKCFVTQPTLSMMIQKLEEELDLKIFDRSKAPVKPTAVGGKIIEQARKVVRESKRMKEIALEEKNEVTGNLSIGIIPTLAPYLLPLFVEAFNRKFPKVFLKVKEMVTADIVDALKRSTIDAGLLVTPLEDKKITEWPVFNERFLVYVPDTEPIYKKKYIIPKDLKSEHLWLLEEGHCFRSQVMNLCSLKEKDMDHSFEYEAGSIETLKRFVDRGQGITIVPELATLDFTAKERKKLRPFKSPQPVREISLVFHREFIKKNLMEKLFENIVDSLPSELNLQTKSKVVPLSDGR